MRIYTLICSGVRLFFMLCINFIDFSVLGFDFSVLSFDSLVLGSNSYALSFISFVNLCILIVDRLNLLI